MRAGTMREVITFERATETVQPSGATAKFWAEEATFRAAIVQESAETFLIGPERTEDRKVFQIWNAAFVDTSLRIVHDGYTYRIAKIVPLGRLMLELHCVNSANEVSA